MPRRPFSIGRRLAVGLVLLVAGGATIVALVHHTPAKAKPGGIVVSTIANQGAASSALADACSIDFVEVEAAVAAYQQQFHHLPPSGTAWIGDVKVKGVQVQYWPTGLGFSLTWDGATVSVNPNGGSASKGSAGSTQTHSGCYDLHLP